MTGLNPASDALRPELVGTRISSRTLVVAAAAGFTALYIVLSLLQPLPIIFPDEFIYGHLAQSLAHGGGFTWRGDPVHLTAAGYVFVITPAWLVDSGVGAYHLAKIENVVLCCLTAVPVWYVARAVLERRLAIAAVVLSLSGTWMVTTAGLLTENLALPLATASLCCAVLALRRPGERSGWLAVVLAVCAVYVRLQLVVLIPALALAFLIDAFREPAAWRERLALHRTPLIALGALVTAGVILFAAAGHAASGIYSDVLHYSPSLSRIAGRSGLQLAQLAVMSGFVPVALIAVTAFRRGAWQDDTIGPLLAVFLPFALALVLESGFFLAGNAPWGIERYVSYAVPLAIVLVLAVLARPELSGRIPLAIAAGLTLLLVLLPHLGNATEERAVAATFVRVRAIFGSMPVGAGVMVGALIASGAVAAAVLGTRRRASVNAAALAGAAVLLAILVVQSASAWSLQLKLSRHWRQAFPPDAQWVDHHTTGRTAVLELTQNALGFEDHDFFNRNIAAYYAAGGHVIGRPVLGRVCSWGVRQDGTLQLDARCGTTPHEFFINDPAARMTFRRTLASTVDPRAGQLVRVGGTPQLLAVIATPCNRPRVRFVAPLERMVPASAPAACAPVLISDLWLDRPATLRLTFRGGAADHAVALGPQQWRVPAHRQITISVPLKSGPSALQFQLDWARRSATDPAFTGAALVQDGRSTPLA